jgi:DNA-binding NarL/FixJ family response regulator
MGYDVTENGPAPIRVFLLDDHEVVRRGVADVLETDPGIAVVGEAKNAAEALARVPALRPDVAVLDVRLPDGDGVSVCRDLRTALPGLKVVVLTGSTDDALVDVALAGASGYLRNDVSSADVVRAVRVVAAGGSLLDPAAVAAARRRATADADAARALAGLTPRERTVAELIGEGLTNREIGTRLHLSEKTVKNHVTALLGKLGLQRRTQVAVLAVGLRPGRPGRPSRPGGDARSAG